MSALRVPAAELRLADVIQLEAINAYHTATVKRIEHGSVTLFRPYVQTEDFSYAGGVICYIGIEQFIINPRPDETFLVLERKELK
jgi:hypothetical protein